VATADDSPVGSSRSLAGAFPAATREEWEAAVAGALKGRASSTLRSTTPGGVEVEPLHVPGEGATGHDGSGFPGAAPTTRGVHPAPRPFGLWEVRRPVDALDATVANRQALEDLERGVTALEIPFPPATPSDLPARLDGVLLDLAPVVLRAGWSFESAASALEGLWDQQGLGGADTVGGFGADPFAALAAEGQADLPVGEALTRAAELAVRTAATRPGVRTMTVSSLPVVESGASEVLELAVVLSTGAAYLRELGAAGLDVDDAVSQIELELAADTDVFVTIAKVRAARRLWSALTSACGGSGVPGSPLSVRTVRRMLTTRDPWVNLLRVTAATFAAGVGGADSITTDSYDALLAGSSDLGRRMARNTQLLLLEESSLGRVLDPAGGSAFLEELTERIAQAAWSTFQQLEEAGGVGRALVDGTLAARVADERSRVEAQVATRRRPITGVSEFPDLEEPAPEVAPVDPHTPLLVPVRWAEGYEELRDLADAARADGREPTVFLANLGPVAVHTARATFTRNLFAAGGIRAVTTERGDTTGYDDPAELAADAAASGAAIVCLCSSDAVYAERGADAAAALAGSGVGRVYLAGAPGDDRERLTAAGVDEFVHIGVDVLDVLRRALEVCGVTGGVR